MMPWAGERRMKFEAPGLATTLCILAGVGLLILSMVQSGILSTVLALYSLLFVNLALLDYVLAQTGVSFLSPDAIAHTRHGLRELSADLLASLQKCVPSRRDALWLTAATGIGIVVRGYSLGQPVGYDEAYTFLNFVQRGFPALFNYPLPNNHILHTVLVRLATLILGTSPAVMRAPAFAAGVATIPLTFCLCRSMLPLGSGYLAASALSVFPYMVLYSTMARGYSLMVLLTVGLAFVGLHVARKPSLPGCGVLSLIGALGMLTIPTMLFALGGVYLWLGSLVVAQRRSVRAVLCELLIPCGIMTSLLTLVFYTPSIIESGGVQSIVANPFVQALPWNDFVGGIAPHFQSVLAQFSWDLPKSMPAICAILVLAGMLGAAYERNWAVLFLAPSMLVGSGVVLVVKQSIPFLRTWIYLIPFALIAVDGGLTYATKRVPRRAQFVCPVLLLTLALSHAVTTMSDNIIAKRADFPDGAGIVQELKSVMSRGDTVHVKMPADWPTYYYMWYYHVPDKVTVPSHSSEFFVVEKRSYSIADLTHEPVVLIAEYGDAALYRLDAPTQR
jgi:Dolichyl-phosphate-mannose-protein mannosyltransferase